MKRKKLIAGNWKMNLDLQGAIALAGDIKKDKTPFKSEVVLIPPYVFITEVQRELKQSQVKVGAQNCSQHAGGAFTGEVSAGMLASAGVEYVIIGHSERREHNGETNPILRAKLEHALKHKLKPIFCCGEPLDVREKNGQEMYVQHQLHESLFAFSEEELADTVIAYEPVWAIGTGKTATVEQAMQMHSFIRKQVAKQYSDKLAQHIRIIYGGSCKPSNAKELFMCPDVDGGLIGGASLTAKDFLAIIYSA